MAIESVTTSAQDAERISELMYKAQGILGLIRSASTSSDSPHEDAIPGACWAVENMLTEIAQITRRLR